MVRPRTQSKASVQLSASTRICVLHGSEPMLQRQYLDELRQALESTHGQVETVTFDGETAALADVLDELRSFGLMGQYKLVVVDQADQFVTTHRKALERYAQQPVDQATLVLRSQRWNKGKLDQLIEPVGCLIPCQPCTEAQAQAWLKQRAEKVHKVRLAPGSAEKLVDRLGCDLMRLDSELGRLALLTKDGKTIDTELVEKEVQRTSQEQAWAVQEAILRAMTRQSASPNHPGSTSGSPGSPSRAAAAALEKLHEVVVLSGQADVFVMYCVADLFRKIWLGKMMQKHGLPSGQIAKQLRLFGGLLQPFLSLLNRLDEHQAHKLFHRILDYDAKAKSGLGEPMRNLECFCARLADELR